MHRILCVCLFVCTTVTNAELKPPDGDRSPKTHSSSGVFRGSWMESRRGRRFHAYRGIRYAEPPVGPLRFQVWLSNSQPPKPILHYKEEVDASTEGPGCPRPVSPESYVDEDCLTVNVYTPGNNSSKPLPVIFFIHPGGFYSMSGRSDIAGPHYLLDRDVVLVTHNYRLGSLGFLALGNQLSPGNNGMKDQVAALRWVQRNIRSFGGDPNLVTIAGCSAGATSVMLHMISPMSTDELKRRTPSQKNFYFHQVSSIAMSGSPTSKVPSPSHGMELAVKQARVSSCPTDNATVIYECLMTKPWREIASSLLGFFEFGFDPLSLWRPVVEPDFGQERFLHVEPMQAIREVKMRSVPFMVSQTTAEFFWKAYTILGNQTLLDTMDAEWDRVAPISFILPRNESRETLRKLRAGYLGDERLVNDDVTADRLGKLYGDAITAFPIHRMANLMCRHSRHPVYYSEFAYLGNRSHYEDPITKKPVRVAHHDDLIYLFTIGYRFPTIDVSSSADSQMVDKMTAMWYNFARYGDPNPRPDTPELAALSWPPMTTDQRSYLHLNQEFSVRKNLFEDRFKLWDELYPILY